jgi:hypothetical protein
MIFGDLIPSVTAIIVGLLLASKVAEQARLVQGSKAQGTNAQAAGDPTQPAGHSDDRAHGALVGLISILLGLLHLVMARMAFF